MKSTEPLRPNSRRGASGAWNRLKPVREDALESYGLPSKGETRLNDFKTQETYFNRIIERYMKLCALNREDLDKLFASVSEKDKDKDKDKEKEKDKATNTPLDSSAAIPTAGADSTRIPQNTLMSSINELSTVLAALRKIREAITASNRCDSFAKRAYFFSVHVAILCKDWQSYTPALAALLNMIHTRMPLAGPDLKEYVGFVILDQACRQGDIAGARETRLRYAYTDRRVDLVLKALVADNWVLFWKMKKAVDGYQRNIIEFAEQGIRMHALKCLGRGYISADRLYVERSADKLWEDLVKDEDVGWELTETDKVLIKKPKTK